MQTLSIWIVAAVISYFSTIWIDDLMWNIIASTIIWYLSVFYIKKWLRGEI